MKNLWLIIITCTLCFSTFALSQEIPSEDELLDFDSLDKAEENSDKLTPQVPPKKVAPPVQAKPAPETQTPIPAPEELPTPSAAEAEAPPPPLPDTQESVAPPPPPEETTAESPPPANENAGQVAAENVSGEDAKSENRFARIYEKFNKSEISDDSWAQIAGNRSSESYVMQQGDNLWDISTKFFGNGFYWPKVWQLNDAITNPHNIKVGNTLRFSPGSSTSPPRLDVDKPNDEPEVESLPMAQTEESTEPGAQVFQTVVIPPKYKSKPVLKKIPPSFPDWNRGFGDQYDTNGFSTEVLSRYKMGPAPKSAVQSIIVDKLWASQGKVVEMEGGLTVASTYQFIILKLKTAAQPGDMFTVFSDNGPIEDEVDDIEVGVEIQTRAEVEIVEPIDGNENTYRALVKFTVLPVRIGDNVIVGQNITRVEFDVEGPQSAVAARIINGEWGKRRVFSLHNVVFLNRGEQDGLQVGMLLPVIKNVRLRNKESIVKYDTKPIGTLKVVHVGSRVSTALIVAEFDAIIPGDETAMSASNSVEAENLDDNSDTGTEDTPDAIEAEEGLEE
ncbi:MAG: LysM peptidoglycan-binding domain-containing protein [Oligoflexia bacterium]|nr:LysM peptidoglycan-binding domain-containing protein [Oligoflexia bacterium]